MNQAKYNPENIYAPNTGAHKYIKQIFTDIKGESGCNKVIIENINTPLTIVDRSSRKKSTQKQRP